MRRIAAPLAGLLIAAWLVFTGASHASAAANPAPVDNQNHLYTLDGLGGLHAAGSSPAAPNVFKSTHYFGWDIARGLALTNDGTGGYILDGFGGLAPVGATPEPGASYIQVYFGWDIARAIVITPWSTASHPSGYILDGWGGIHPFGGAPEIPAAGYWPGWDIARALVISQDSTPDDIEGWMLDGYGGIHSIGSRAHQFQLNQDMTWFGFDVARGLVAEPASTATSPSLYVLDAYGGINALGSAPRVTTPAYCPGCEFAHSIAAWTKPGGGGGWIQDGRGNLYPFGGAPNVPSNTLFDSDLGRGVAGSGGGSGTLPGNFAAAHQPAVDPPVRIRIPAIGVDASLEQLTLDSNSELQAPNYPSDAGWWRDGPSPGQAGNAIINGHRDTWTSGAAVFYQLPNLPAGSLVTITLGGGGSSQWRTRAPQSYPASSVPGWVFSSSGPPTITLITCGGSFDGTHYSDRILVVADPA